MSADVVNVIDDSVGVHATAPTCYLSVLARAPESTIGDFDAAIESGALVRARAMRQSFYVFSPELLRVAVAATRQQAERTIRQSEDDITGYESLAARVEELLTAGAVPDTRLRRMLDPDGDMEIPFDALLARMAAECRIVRTAGRGSWRSDRYSFARWADWVPGPSPLEMDRSDAMRQLAQRYVAGYGPVTVDDVRWWTGWSREDTITALDGVDLEVAGTAADVLDGLRLLPVWDSLTVAYVNREGWVEPEFASFVHDRYGNATSVVFDRGAVVGQWDLGETDDPLAVAVAPFRDWTERRWGAVETEVARIAALIGSDSYEVRRVEEPVDLLDTPRNRFLHPLLHAR
jgi:hypothetical protein